MSEVKRAKLGPVSAYAIAVKNGFEGTEKEWLESLAAGEYADRTEGFQAQSEYASPVEYLRSLGPGAWRVMDADSLYMTKILESGAGRVISERLISDDGFLYDNILLNGELIYSLSTESGEMSIAEYRVITDRNVQLASDEDESGGVEVPSVGKMYSLIVQECGSGADLVMSQAAVTQVFDSIAAVEEHRPVGTAALATVCKAGVITSTTAGELYRTMSFAVRGGVTYTITGSTGYKNDYYAFLDALGNVLSYLESPNSAYAAFSMTVAAPEGAAKLVVNYLGTMGEPTAVSEPSYVPQVRREDFEALKAQTNHFRSLRWAVFGDSLTEKNFRAETSYYDYVREELGCSVINHGLSGSGYKAREDEGQAFYQRMLTVDPDAFDVLTIFGSGNDLSHTLGEVTDTGTDTLCGCINTTLDNFYQIAPDKVIGLVTPTPWYPYPQTDADNVMEKYAKAIVEIARRRGIPCLDLYHCSGLRPWDDTVKTLLFNENGEQDSGVHPNSEGHRKFIYPHFREFLKTLA